jgi:hypothetical protein
MKTASILAGSLHDARNTANSSRSEPAQVVSATILHKRPVALLGTMPHLFSATGSPLHASMTDMCSQKVCLSEAIGVNEGQQIRT